MDLQAAARTLLEQNTQRWTKDGVQHTFTAPSTKRYPFQWLWDSCFHAIVWTHFDVERAKEELRALLTGLRPDGFLPHILYWDQSKVQRAPWSFHWQESRGLRTCLPWTQKPATSEGVQPPILAQAVARINETAHDGHAFLREVVPHLDLLYGWWLRERDPDGDHLVSIVSQYESGLDSLPAYDPVIHYTHGQGPLLYFFRARSIPFLNKLLYNYQQNQLVRYGPFHVEDVFLNTLLALNLDVLASLHERVGEKDAARGWRRESRQVSDALLKKCWDAAEGAFFNLDGRREHRSTILTVSSLFPLVLPWMEKDMVAQLVERHLTNEKEFWLPYPVPSVAATEPAFSPESKIGHGWPPFHWRGSTWVSTNWYLVHGLRHHGYADLADHIAAQTRAMVEKNGFREYYSPVTAKGLSAHDFGWSTLVVDM